MASSSSKKKTFDVTKPGKSSPEATARPIIVSNRSIVRDPTLKQGNEQTTELEKSTATQDGVAATPKKVSTQARTIQPLSGLTDEDTDKKVEAQKEDMKISESTLVDEKPAESKDEPEKTNKSVKEDVKPDKSKEEVEETSKPPAEEEKPEEADKTDEKPEESGESESTDNNTEIDAALAGKKEENKQTAEEKAHKELVEKLVAEGKYVVPIGQVKRRRNTRNILMVIALMLIVGVVAADLLIDAGTIQTDIKPVVDLIKN